MNRISAVLAADSATTVSRWTSKGKEVRYFKGANKIFQLSIAHPVGLMIFASAELMSVPWETIIKLFRNNLGQKSHNTIADYAQEFFDFLCTNYILFPEGVRKDHFVSAIKSEIYNALFEVEETDNFDDSDAPQTAVNGEILQQKLDQIEASLAAIPLPSCVTQEALNATKAKWRDAIVQVIDEVFEEGIFGDAIDKTRAADVFIDQFIKNPRPNGSATGLVFCGFGDHEIFPSYTEYRLHAIVGECALYKLSSAAAISHETPAGIKAFAQTSMADTFVMGISSDVYISVISAVQNGLDQLTASLLDSLGNPPPPASLAQDVNAAQEAISSQVLNSARQEHAFPLWQVIASLPIEEMSELAETLIRLQSLKEKVTSPTETVGGPVDVAVITKAEGLVWIKRKHFFPAELNSAYALRQKSLYE